MLFYWILKRRKKVLVDFNIEPVQGYYVVFVTNNAISAWACNKTTTLEETLSGTFIRPLPQTIC